MLVVVSIMMMLVAMAASVFRPANDSRRIRETARSINVYLSSARNRAMETGRPCGVVLRRFDATIPCAMTLEQCEVPPSYSGIATDSRAFVELIDQAAKLPVGFYTTTSQTVVVYVAKADYDSSFISPGDLIQFNAQGPFYSILRAEDDSKKPYKYYDDGNYVGFLAQIDMPGQQLPWQMDVSPAAWKANKYYLAGPPAEKVIYQGQVYVCKVGKDPNEIPEPDPSDLNYGKAPSTNPTYWELETYSSTSIPTLYRIFRYPRRTGEIIKNAAQTLQLPAATVIDLVDSGVGAGIWGGGGDVAILFAPNGAIEAVYVDGTQYSVVDQIYLLVGHRERVPFDATQYDANNPDTFANWQDLSNLWVVINPLTGLVTTAEMAAVTTSVWSATTDYVPGDVVTVSGVFYSCASANKNKPPASNTPAYWSDSGAVGARALARDMQGMGGK